MELHAEHENVCYAHRINLRPVIIALFDSNTHWGMFHPATRTISISRKLIANYPWHVVLGIFRHEMAHQLVDEGELDQDAKDTRLHGEAFQRACERIGVPDQFTKAGVDLKTCHPDWRETPRDPEKEALLQKAQKLLALARSSNEHEALLAMEKVRELYAKYNLDRMSTMEAEGFVHQVLSRGKKTLSSWELGIANILSEHFFVKTIICQQFDPKIIGRVSAIQIIGRKENVLMAEYVYSFLNQQLNELLSKEVANNRTFNRCDRRSFRLGVLEGFSKKLAQSRQAQPFSNPPSRIDGALTKSRELTILGRAFEQFKSDRKMEEYLRRMYPRLSMRSPSKSRVNVRAFSAGRQAGHAMNLYKPVTWDMENRGFALTNRSKKTP